MKTLLRTYAVLFLTAIAVCPGSTHGQIMLRNGDGGGLGPINSLRCGPGTLCTRDGGYGTITSSGGGAAALSGTCDAGFYMTSIPGNGTVVCSPLTTSLFSQPARRGGRMITSWDSPAACWLKGELPYVYNGGTVINGACSDDSTATTVYDPNANQYIRYMASAAGSTYRISEYNSGVGGKGSVTGFFNGRLRPVMCSWLHTSINADGTQQTIRWGWTDSYFAGPTSQGDSSREVAMLRYSTESPYYDSQWKLVTCTGLVDGGNCNTVNTNVGVVPDAGYYACLDWLSSPTGRSIGAWVTGPGMTGPSNVVSSAYVPAQTSTMGYFMSLETDGGSSKTFGMGHLYWETD